MLHIVVFLLLYNALNQSNHEYNYEIHQLAN